MRTPTTPSGRLLPFLLALLLLALPSQAQDEPAAFTIQVEPASLTLEVGQTAQLSAKVLDANGVVQDMPIMFFSRSRRSVAADRSTGEVKALKPGSFEIFVSTFSDGTRISSAVPVDVLFPPIESITFTGAPAHLYATTTVPIVADVIDASNAVRADVQVRFSSSNPAIASVDAFGHVTAHQPGTFDLHAEAEGIHATTTLEVVTNPIARVQLHNTRESARTGDVIDYDAMAYDAAGNVVEDAYIHYAFRAQPADNLGPAATGQIRADGRFVAEVPGRYTIIASVGSATDLSAVEVTTRNVQREVELISQGVVSDVNTSDLWVWEGVDGRDYAVTGTWGANGEAYFWDVTDPATPVIVDTVTVDARTVNDVKVNERGDVCVISREGASNRRNGLVILDCTDPHNVSVLAEYDENLTGGVHNVFVYDQHIYALSAGQRYDIINIADPKQPHRVGSFELETPGHSIHDVWVEDGIAYSSNWSDGVWMVDVGNGIKGGSPENPVVVGHYAYPSGWNHAAFPYRDEETGKFYIIAGDEANRNGRMAGWIHFIDFTDPENPQEVARYEVPEAGSHNLWVEDGKLYVAYYQGGLRVVDIKGDLMGDLYRQGREIARYYTASGEGFTPNAPMAWGPQPHKGHIFVSDMNSGLWVIKLQGDEEEQKPGT